MSIPIIDLSAAEVDAVSAIGRACRESGFFYVVGHGVDAGLGERLEQLSRQFFAQPVQRKMQIRMAVGGRAWRGYFPVGDELTSGRPDQKEGLYFGAELGTDDPRVVAKTPQHGPNLFPDLAGFQDAVLEYIDAQTRLGHRIVELLGLSLGLDRGYFADRYTADPLILFRIFHYPPLSGADTSVDWSVGEHTDYGLLTILRQDATGGLQVKGPQGWLDAPPIADSFVCNLGDMLDRMTGGLYRSTPHRVRNVSGRSRLSFPFFFDPNFNADVRPIDGTRPIDDDAASRWDARSVHTFHGTYGQYLLEKVARVFPQLRADAAD